MPQLEHIDAIERRLWSAADTLRANSKYASNEYFLPVMGLVFLRHAYSRYLAVKDEIEAGLPTRGGRTRPLTREDFAQKSAIFLRQEAQFDYLVALPDGEDRATVIIAAMESIEADYDSLRGVLPKSEYQALDNEVLGDLLRKLNPDERRVAEIRANAKGTTYPEISKGRFRAINIVISGGALAEKFSDIALEIVRQVRCLKRSISQLKNARDAFLPRLMNGESAV